MWLERKTGKTHTLIEIIRRLVAEDKKVLVCGASNLAVGTVVVVLNTFELDRLIQDHVDNLLERLVPHKIPLTRLGHPARVLSTLHGATLDSQATNSDEAALANDVKREIDTAMTSLSGKGKGRLRGGERKKMWDEVRELRKELSTVPAYLLSL